MKYTALTIMKKDPDWYPSATILYGTEKAATKAMREWFGDALARAGIAPGEMGLEIDSLSEDDINMILTDPDNETLLDSQYMVMVHPLER